MRTTLDLPDETFRQLKAQAAHSGLKLKELLTQIIQRDLTSGVIAPMPKQQPSPSPDAIERISASTTASLLAPIYPIPVAREADGTVTPYLTNAQLYAILDEEDIAQYQRVLQQSSVSE